MGPTVHVQSVHVDICHGSGQRVDRRHRVVLRTEEALLFRRDGHEQNRSLRRRRQLRERPRDLDQAGRAHRVVLRAVIDPIAIDRRADPEMIPVGRVDDVLVVVRLVAAFELRDDVV